MLPRPEVAVGAVVVRDGELLLVKRGRGSGVGLWSLPGGRVEPGESLAAAVARELAEETGLAGTVGALCGIAEHVDPQWHYVILDFFVEVPPDAVATAGDDADDVIWASRSDLDRLALVTGLVSFLGEHRVLDRLT